MDSLLGISKPESMNAIILALVFTVVVFVDFFWEPICKKFSLDPEKAINKVVFGGLLLALGWWQAVLQYRDDKQDDKDMGVLQTQLATANSSVSNSFTVITNLQTQLDAANNTLKTFREQSTLDTTILIHNLFRLHGYSAANLEFFTGLFAQYTRRADEAERAYRRSLRIDPSHSGARNNLALLLHARGLTEEAFIHYERAYLANTNDSTAALNYANHLGNRGRGAEAVSICQTTMNVTGLHADAALSLAEQLVNYAPTNHFWRYLNQYMIDADKPDVRRIVPMIKLHWTSLTPEHKTGTSNWLDFLPLADADELRRAFPKTP
jgi:tetratricopeptide (TPR) repeat protein